MLWRGATEQGGRFLPDSAGVDKGFRLPTRVNVYTVGWRELVTSYGVPGYQVANPALFITSHSTDPMQDGVVPITDEASQHARRMKSASMVQLRNVRGIADVLSVLVQASVFSSADAQRLTALVQSSHQAAGAGEDDDAGAPDAAVYKDYSGGIVATLEDLLDKAQSQLDDAVKKETAALRNCQMLKQSLENEIKFANKELGDAKKGIAANGETQAKQEDKNAEVDKLSTQISQMSSRSAQLKEEVAGLQGALAALTKSQADLNRVRADECFKSAPLTRQIFHAKEDSSTLSEEVGRDDAHCESLIAIIQGTIEGSRRGAHVIVARISLLRV